VDAVKRGGPLKRRRSTKRVIDRVASEGWAKGARCKRCAICNASNLVRGHHIIPQQRLRQIARDTGLEYERIRWDDRNRLPLCDRHHEAHHNRAYTIPLDVVLTVVPKFVRELDRAYGEEGREPVGAWVARMYPARDRDARIVSI
jgi:hypothetical protein